jgi:hypothetical protein
MTTSLNRVSLDGLHHQQRLTTWVQAAKPQHHRLGQPYAEASCYALQIYIFRSYRPATSPCLLELTGQKPRPDQFFCLNALPRLGTVKLDLQKIREMALKPLAYNGIIGGP